MYPDDQPIGVRLPAADRDGAQAFKIVGSRFADDFAALGADELLIADVRVYADGGETVAIHG